MTQVSSARSPGGAGWIANLCKKKAIHNFQNQALKTVAVFEAKNRISELLAAVAQGEEITITRHGSPVARLVALSASDQPAPKQSDRVAAAMQRLRAVGAGAELGCTVQNAIQHGHA